MNSMKVKGTIFWGSSFFCVKVGLV